MGLLRVGSVAQRVRGHGGIMGTLEGMNVWSGHDALSLPSSYASIASVDGPARLQPLGNGSNVCGPSCGIHVASMSSVPDEANVVVVGGGIIGSSIAYHLAKAGCDGVVLLERDRLTSGTTWHAAGLMVTYGSTSETSTEMRKYTKELYSTILPEETGQDTGFKPVGFIELATSKDRLEEFRRTAAFNRACGVDVHEIGPDEVARLFPLCEVSDVEAGFYVEDDGRVNPVDAAMAFTKGARMYGAQVLEGVTVDRVTAEGVGARRRVTGVVTEGGHTMKANYVVNAAGMWARQFGEAAGVTVPNQAAEHYYLITDPMPEVDPMWPVVEDPSSYTYIRPEAGGLMVGLFETEAAAWNVDSIPQSFSFGEIEPDWERMAPFVEKAMSRVPATLSAGAKTFFCGPESFTPDLAPLVGEAPELRNYFVAAGLNSIGILSGGGIGQVVADWIMNKYPSADVTGMNVDRVRDYMGNPEFRGERVVESLGMVYKPHYPSYQLQTARGVKRSPIHDRLADHGAFFGDISGWEGPLWYAPEGKEPVIDQLTWGRENWFPYWEAEHKACREGVALIDMSFMSKFLVQGADAGRCLNRISTANVDSQPGRITYTQWLDPTGRVQADLTVAKLDEERFLVIATDTAHRHVETWMNRCFIEDPETGETSKPHAFVTDVTGGYAQLNVQGPLSRDLLQTLTSDDLSDSAFPFRAAREISIGYARVLCARITYVGELGYELYVPTEQAVHVYDRIMAASTTNGDKCSHVGLKALSSLRLEKAYRDFGHDVDNTDRLGETGLSFTCDFDKEGGFIGKDAVLDNTGVPNKRLVQVLLNDPEPFMHHAEIIIRNGTVVGDVRAASYGHTLGGAVGIGAITADTPITNSYINAGKWEVDVAGTRYPATVSLRPQYDPRGARVRM